MKHSVDIYAHDALRALWNHYYKLGWQAAINAVVEKTASISMPLSYPGPIPRCRSLVKL